MKTRFVSLVSLAALVVLIGTSAPAATRFSAPIRLGYKAGDDWEPSIAADRFGHVYAWWTHYDPTCASCTPHLETLQISSDGGHTWSAPRQQFPATVSQDDPQIAVDPADGRTVWISYMQGPKSSQYGA